MRIPDAVGNDVGATLAFGGLTFLAVQVSVAAMLFGLYYFVSFEVAVIAALSIIVVQVAQ